MLTGTYGKKSCFPPSFVSRAIETTALRIVGRFLMLFFFSLFTFFTVVNNQSPSLCFFFFFKQSKKEYFFSRSFFRSIKNTCLMWPSWKIFEGHMCTSGVALALNALSNYCIIKLTTQTRTHCFKINGSVQFADPFIRLPACTESRQP